MFKVYKKIVIISSISLLLLIFLYKMLFFKQDIIQDTKVVEVTKVVKKTIKQTIKLTGKIRPKMSASLMARSPGIFSIIVLSGNKVMKDTVIAKIHSNEIEKRYELCIAAESIAHEQFDRAYNLTKSGAYSKADLESLQSKWINSQKDLADAKLSFDKLKVYAPFDGIIGSYKQKEGAQLRGDEFIVSFYDPNELTLEFDIPASVIQHVNNGQDLLIDNKHYQLTHVQKMLDDEKHMSPASVDIICPDCIIGSNIDIILTVKTKENALVIPYDSTFLRDTTQNVYVVQNNIVALKKVQTGIREKEEIEITDGLVEGDVIIAKSTNRLYPGASVKINGFINE